MRRTPARDDRVGEVGERRVRRRRRARARSTCVSTGSPPPTIVRSPSSVPSCSGRVGDRAGLEAVVTRRARASAAAATSSFWVDAPASARPGRSSTTAPPGPSTVTQLVERRDDRRELALQVRRGDRRRRTPSARGAATTAVSRARGCGAAAGARSPASDRRARRATRHSAAGDREDRGDGRRACSPRSGEPARLAEARVAPEVPERGDRAVRGRVAEAAGGADGRRARGCRASAIASSVAVRIGLPVASEMSAAACAKRASWRSW